MFGRAKNAAPVSDEAEAVAPAESQYITRAEAEALIAAAVDAAIGAQAIVNREIAGGARDAFFSAGRLEGRLQQEALSEDLSEAVVRCLQRSVAAMSGKAVKSYDVDRSPHRAPWST
jgi:hypothetical protein